MEFFHDSIKRHFFNIKTYKDSFLNITFLLGSITVFFNRQNISRFFKFLLFSSFLVTFSYFFTESVLGMNFIPNYCVYFFIEGVKIFIIAYAVYFLIEKKLIAAEGFKWFVILLLCAINLADFRKAINSERTGELWPAIGRNGLFPWWTSLQEYVLKNTNVNDVFLSTKELGFGINALTGRKLVTNRWAHQNDPYEDFSQRDAAAAIILYGNNDSERLRLLKEYNVKYLYWDFWWFTTQFKVNEKGEITGIFDPFLCFYSPELEKKFVDNAIQYSKDNFWVDPALRGRNYPRYDLLIVLPDRKYDFFTPWHNELNKYLRQTWVFKDNNANSMAVLYEVIADEWK